MATTHRTHPAGMITTPTGPTFVKNNGQSGARSGDHTNPVVALDGQAVHPNNSDDAAGEVQILVEQFLDDICSDYGVAVKVLDPDAVKLLQEYNWTGNIRELRNVVERLVILSSGKTISAEDVKNYVMPK